jgi:hypothetical protein
MTCSDVMRVRRGDSKVSGRRLAGAHGGSRSRASERRNHASSTRSLPTARRHVFRKEQTNVALLASLHTRPPIDVGMHLPAPMKGLRNETLLTECSLRTKAGRGRARSDAESVSRSEDPRVRECDLITYSSCIAPALPSDRHRRGSHQRKLMVFRERALQKRASQRAKAPRTGVAS